MYEDFLLAIVLSVLRFRYSDYPFGIFFGHLSFGHFRISLWYLQTLLYYSNVTFAFWSNWCTFPCNFRNTCRSDICTSYLSIRIRWKWKGLLSIICSSNWINWSWIIIMVLRNRLLDQGYKKIRLIRSLKKFIFRYKDLVEIYSVSAEKIINDGFSYSENV
jgi:hypothetical protein